MTSDDSPHGTTRIGFETVAPPFFVAVEDLDFTTLERFNGSHVSDELHSREGDIVWRVRLRNTQIQVYVLVELQSEVQRFMALRQSVYLGLFYQQVLKQGGLNPDGRLPLVLSIVVYNGKVRWAASLELAELIGVPAGASEVYAPRLRYRLIDMEADAPAELRGSNLVALLIRLERGRTRSSLRRIIRERPGGLSRHADRDRREMEPRARDPRREEGPEERASAGIGEGDGERTP